MNWMVVSSSGTLKGNEGLVMCLTPDLATQILTFHVRLVPYVLRPWLVDL